MATGVNPKTDSSHRDDDTDPKSSTRSFQSDGDTPTLPKMAKIMASKENLKGCQMNQWNDRRAHVVYRAFNVKRFIVDEEHILFPLGGPSVGEGLKNYQDLGEVSDSDLEDDQFSPVMFRQTNWSKFEPRMRRILRVFQHDSHLLLEDLPTSQAFEDAEVSLTRKMNYLASKRPKDDKLLNEEEVHFHKCIRNLVKEIKLHHLHQKTLPKSSLEAYFESLICMFHNLSGFNIRSAQSTICSMQYSSMASFGTVPKPDLYLLSDSSGDVLAVVEVKNASKPCFKDHSGHCTESCKDRLKTKRTQGYVNDSNHSSMEIDVEKGGEECEDSEGADVCQPDEKCDDDFDQQECQVEEARKNTLPKHIRHLDAVEKKQTRCFLPQLFGQMLACTMMEDKGVPVLQDPYMTKILGIGLIGLQAQFVMLVLEDLTKGTVRPTAHDMQQRNVSVRPYMYITRKLNLFKRDDLEIFFRTLFALCNLQKIGRHC